LSITLLEDGRLLEVNAAFLRMTGFSRDEVIGRSTLELGLWDNQSQNRLMMAKALRENGAIVDFETKFRKKSGEIRDALLFSGIDPVGTGRTLSPRNCAGCYGTKSGRGSAAKVIRAS